MGLREQITVKLLAVYVVVGFIVTEIVMVSSCVPYNGYWRVPAGDQYLDQCAYYQHYSIAQAVFNTTSDAMMLAVPIPLLLRSSLPKKQKFAMVIIFGMGIFVASTLQTCQNNAAIIVFMLTCMISQILSAILSKAISLMPDKLDSITYTFWYMRESSVAIYVANLPLLWPIIHKFISWFSHKTGLGTTTTGTNKRGHNTTSVLHDHEMKSTIRKKSQRLTDEEEGREFGSGQSWAKSTKQNKNPSSASNASVESVGGILKQDTFEVRVTESNKSTVGRAQGFQGQEPEYNVTVT